jgi:hypothetical protein
MDYQLPMRPLVFQCPVTGTKVQGMIAEAFDRPNVLVVPIDCSICKHPHMINPTIGKTPNSGSDD